MKSGQDEGSGTGVGYATARGRDWPSVRQFNVFVENRVGNLLTVVRHFETTDIRIVSLTVVDSADCAIIRLVLSDPERAYLRAMAELARGPGPIRSSAVAAVLGKKVTAVAPTRDALIKKALCYSPHWGEIDFTVPMFDGFMKRLIPDLAMFVK